MNKNTFKGDKTVIMSDKYISESGVQGGKIIGEHIVLGSLIFGIPFLIMGLYSLFSMLFGFWYPYKYGWYNRSTIVYGYWFITYYWCIQYLYL